MALPGAPAAGPSRHRLSHHSSSKNSSLHRRRPPPRGVIQTYRILLRSPRRAEAAGMTASRGREEAEPRTGAAAGVLPEAAGAPGKWFNRLGGTPVGPGRSSDRQCGLGPCDSGPGPVAQRRRPPVSQSFCRRCRPPADGRDKRVLCLTQHRGGGGGGRLSPTPGDASP